MLACFRSAMTRAKEPSRNRSVRLPESLWKRIESHAEALTEQDPALRYSTNDVVRLAVEAFLAPKAVVESAKPAKRTPKRKP